MAQTFLICDFGKDEDAAQQARHTIDRWKQGFRLDKKMLLQFDRGEEGKDGAEARPIRVIVRLDFSDHEKLSHQRWADRIPGEVPFKDAKPKVVRAGDADFASTVEQFDALERTGESGKPSGRAK